MPKQLENKEREKREGSQSTVVLFPEIERSFPTPNGNRHHSKVVNFWGKLYKNGEEPLTVFRRFRALIDITAELKPLEMIQGWNCWK
jgi:hypothetical protein